MGKLFEDKITKLTELEAAQCLGEAWKSLYGQYPSTDTLAVLWAKTALETGRWKAIHCYNWGNIKRSANENYCMFRCSEIIKGKELWFDPPHPQTWFRAYESATEGAIDYLKLLSQSKRYSKAWEAVHKGDPALFSHELKVGGYYTASESLYTKGVVSLTNEFKKKVKDNLTWPISPPILTEPVPVVEISPTKTQTMPSVTNVIPVDPQASEIYLTRNENEIIKEDSSKAKKWIKNIFEKFTNKK